MAENITEIRIRDNQNWLSIEGISTNWTNASKKYKEERVQPWYLSPEIVTDTWGGAEFDVQHVRWDAWYCQFFLRESELKYFSQMKSTKEVSILVYSEVNSTIINNTYTLDTRKGDYITISEPQRADSTTGWKVDIIFRTNRTVINKALPIAQTNNISFTSNTYYSDFDILPWNKDVDDVNVQWSDNTIKKAQRTNKDGYEFVYYSLLEDHDEFIEDLKSATSTTINSIPVTEVEFEKILIAEGLMKIIVRAVVTTTVTTDYLNSNQDHELSIDDGGVYFYYTDYPPELISESPIIDTTENQTGVAESTKAISKTVRQLKFYLTETSAFSLKSRFERKGETAIIDGTYSVLENREVSSTRLGKNLYEVVINCLTEVISD